MDCQLLRSEGVGVGVIGINNDLFLCFELFRLKIFYAFAVTSNIQRYNTLKFPTPKKAP